MLISKHGAYRPVHVILIYAVLAGLTCFAFYGIWNNAFIDFDDNTYVFLNPNVTQGLNWQTVQWAFEQTYACNWHPLTWLSHALDCELFGLNPAGHHLTSLIIHIVNVLLVFYAISLFTGAIWRSALVAILFGIHPLRVESVAWVAERKDLLSGLFFLLSIIFYGYYARAKNTNLKPTQISGFKLPQSKHYWLSLLMFVCGLLSKPMLVTMPFVLLLLDFWPLRRFDLTDAQKRWDSAVLLVQEKLPFFLFTVVSCLVTLTAQDTAIAKLDEMSLPHRFGNAVQAYCVYLQQSVWPTKLSVFYPQASLVFGVGPVVAAFFLLAVTAAVLFFYRKHRCLLTGWFWFVGMIVPVSGIVQVGSQAHADRYTYLPSIGLLFMIVWYLEALLSRYLQIWLKSIICICAITIILMLSGATRRQASMWHNTETLFTHAALNTRDNYFALTMLANEDLKRGGISAADTGVDLALKINPRFGLAVYLKSTILQMQGKMLEAIPYLEKAIAPEIFEASRARLVLSYLETGRLADAAAIAEQLSQLSPHDPNVALMKAAVLAQMGRVTEAAELFGKVTSVYEPPFADNPTFNFGLAELYEVSGQSGKASAFYSKAIELFPDHLNSLNNYAWLLATDGDANVRDGKRAVEFGARACELTQWKQPVILGTLAAAYAEAGRFDDAVKLGEQARDKARAGGLTELAKQNAELVEQYRKKMPYHKSAPKPD